jgi:hypothetical protein
MDTYELADINDWSCCAHVKEVSAMLRQQADRIAELEKQLKVKESIYAAEPYLSDWAKRVKEQYGLQIKELSDEEILEVASEFWANRLGYALKFARAILKKANEK